MFGVPNVSPEVIPAGEIVPSPATTVVPNASVDAIPVGST
jgi:hypothetical protein